MKPALATTLFAPFELKAQDDTARTFEGIAAAYTQDAGGDVIHPGAFKRTLDHWRGSGRVVPLLDQHAASLNPAHSVVAHTLGKMIEATEEASGLRARFQVAKTKAGDDLLALLRDGMVEGLSIGYKAVNPQPREDGGRDLREVKLSEISVVTFGMNADALIDLSSVKSLLGKSDLSDEERAELLDLKAQIERALQPALPVGLAPEDPHRLDIESKVRGLMLHSLATP